jgi:sugar lactone lactonase YvrE
MASAAGSAGIQSISPSQGAIAGGDIVTLSGSGFTGTMLTLDGTAIAPISASETQIAFRTPAHDNGIASVKLSGNGPNAYAEFLYLPPSVQSLPPGYVTTVMGIGVFRGDGRQATHAVVDAGAGLVVAADDTLYFTEGNNSVIRRVRTDGVIESYAGIGNPNGPLGDGGPAGLAALAHSRGLAIDSSGNVLLAASMQYNAIRRIDSGTGIITTIAGGETAGYSGDGGPASQAQLNYPLQVASDGSGNLYILECGGLFVCDQPRVRKVDANGIITTIAGTGRIGSSGDSGPALAATFDIGTADLGGLAADAAGNVYVADSQNNRVRKIDARTGAITTVYAANSAVLSVATDASANVYVGLSCCSTPSILKLTSSGNVLQKWGSGFGFSDDGATAAGAQFCNVQRIALDSAGNILFAEDCSGRIRRINAATGLLETVAGMGPHIIGETGPALATMLNDPGTDLLFLPTGELLTAEGSNYRIRKMDLQGNVSVFAGNGFLGVGYHDGVPALQAYVYPIGLARAPNGDILMVGGPAQGLSRIDTSGIIHNVTKTQVGFGGDGGPAAKAMLDEPYDVAADAAGNLYVADTNNNRIRRIDAATGIITTVVGSGPVNGNENYGAGGDCGDGGPATQACLNTPYGIAVGPDGAMYIGSNFERIRKVDASGIMTTLSSESQSGVRLRLGPGGNLFANNIRIEPNGHAWRLPFGAQASGPGIGDGGPVAQARTATGPLSQGIAADTEGNLYFADSGNRRIRVVRYGAVLAEPGSTVAVSGGTPQIATPGTVFPVALEVTLRSPAGTPENGVRVDFAAPASGASCTFPGGGSTFSALTDISGQVAVVCTGNSQAGSYRVTATPLTLGTSATFSLANAGLRMRRRPR